MSVTPTPLISSIAHSPDVHGLPLDAIGGAVRPGTVALADARDERPPTSSFCAPRRQCEGVLGPVRFRTSEAAVPPRGFVRAGRTCSSRAPQPASRLVIYDARLAASAELGGGTRGGYESRAGQEYPTGGLLVKCVWEAMPGGETLQAHELHEEPIRLPPTQKF